MTTDPKLTALGERLNSLKAKDIMTRSVITVQKEMPLASLAQMLLDKKISGLPVVDPAGKAIGVITATDLFTLMFMLKTGQMSEDGKQGVCNPTVEFAMSKEVFSAKEETSLEEIMSIMWGRNIHTLPVMKGAEILGIIGRRDVLKHFYAIVKELFE